MSLHGTVTEPNGVVRPQFAFSAFFLGSIVRRHDANGDAHSFAVRVQLPQEVIWLFSLSPHRLGDHDEVLFVRGTKGFVFHLEALAVGAKVNSALESGLWRPRDEGDGFDNVGCDKVGVERGRSVGREILLEQ
jgi:hypothetical protein